ncbi:MAG: hypothetical protein JXR88_02840 [Clostridia bacterium]|nr:hypothetical protein [Clostridia bacterium]
MHAKTVIVGHWPASDLRTNIHYNLPHYNDHKNVITIDGGLGVKSSGELNAFIITKKNNSITYNVIQSNIFEEKEIVKGFEFPKETLTFVNYPHFDIEVLEVGERFTLCKHLHTGNIISVFNSLIEKVEDQHSLKTIYINKFFNLKPGDKVELCKAFEDCIHVKSGGEFGWVLPEQIG